MQVTASVLAVNAGIRILVELYHQLPQCEYSYYSEEYGVI